ncbi:MAG: hypothetical protein ACLPH3_05865 [Terracidiphilus sp.]
MFIRFTPTTPSTWTASTKSKPFATVTLRRSKCSATITARVSREELDSLSTFMQMREEDAQ